MIEKAISVEPRTLIGFRTVTIQKTYSEDLSVIPALDAAY